jgi:hypothetical protein
MSLVVGWLMDNFVAIAGDDKAIVREESGKARSLGEDVPKFYLFTPEVIIAAAGDNQFFDVLVRSIEPLVEQSHGDEQLFEYLTTAIPLAAQGIARYSEARNQELLLTGYDATQKRFRCMQWTRSENFVEHEILSGRVLVMGYGEASKTLARELARGRLSQVESLDEVRPTLEGVVRDVSALVSERTNGTVTSCLIYRERVTESALVSEARR